MYYEYLILRSLQYPHTHCMLSLQDDVKLGELISLSQFKTTPPSIGKLVAILYIIVSSNVCF